MYEEITRWLAGGDTAYDEDHSAPDTVHDHAAQLRIGAFHLIGRRDIIEANRAMDGHSRFSS